MTERLDHGGILDGDEGMCHLDVEAGEALGYAHLDECRGLVGAGDLDVLKIGLAKEGFRFLLGGSAAVLLRVGPVRLPLAPCATSSRQCTRLAQGSAKRG